MKIKKRNLFRIIWFGLVSVFLIWQWSTYQSRDLPKQTLISTQTITVAEDRDKITFYNTASVNALQIIFFQGGLTDPKAYAPLCRQLAEHGFTTHLIKMNWRMPQWDYQKIIQLFDLANAPFIIGGHSQGAKMASQFVFENPGLMKGLFLLGTSHPRDYDLSSQAIPTIKLYAEHDGLASVEEVMENQEKLPLNSRMLMIEGGNHSQFGYLGKIFLDESSTISLKQQQAITSEALISFFENIE